MLKATRNEENTEKQKKVVTTLWVLQHENKNKDWDDISDINESIKEKKEKEVAENDDQVDKLYQRISAKLSTEVPFYTVFWNGKTTKAH